MLAAAQADELGLMPRLREEFGPEAHLAVSAGTGGLFVLAARAGQQNDVAAAVRRRMAEIVPARLTGTRPGILAMFIEDTDRLEWRLLREKLELEGVKRGNSSPTLRLGAWSPSPAARASSCSGSARRMPRPMENFASATRRIRRLSKQISDRRSYLRCELLQRCATNRAYADLQRRVSRGLACGLSSIIQ